MRPKLGMLDMAVLSGGQIGKRALAGSDVNTAVRERRDACGLALEICRCETIVDGGNAALRIRAATGVQQGFDEKARNAYLIAVVRARNDRSVTGLRRIADAFVERGDHQTAARVRRLADEMS